MNLRKQMMAALVAVAMLMMTAGDAVTQSRGELREEFHQTYPIAADGRVSLENINGSVRVSVWDRNEVKVDAVKHAYKQERLNEARIEVDAGSDSIRIRTDYPSENQTFTDESSRRYDNPATVEYTLTVPRNARINSIELINGAIDIEGVAGDVEASSINGRVTAKGLRGEAKLTTINGPLDATFDSLNESKTVSLGSVNGSIALTLPSDASAQLKANTVHGSISNNFGLPVRRGQYVGRDLSGTLGHGGPRIKLGNVNGGITIQHAQDGRQLSPATNLLEMSGNNNDGDEDFDDAQAEAQREAREAAREAQRAQRDAERAQREAERAQRQAQVEAGRAQTEAQRSQIEAAREARDAQREAEREAREAQMEAARAAREAQQEGQRAAREAQVEAARAQRDALREVERSRVEIARAAREASNVVIINGDTNMRLVERDNKTFAVSGTPTVNVETFDGAVTVRSWDKAEVMYTVTKRAENEQGLQGIQFRADQNGSTVNIVADFDKTHARRIGGIYSINATANLEIFVPRNANLHISSKDGRLYIEGVNGELNLQTADGSVDVRDGRGNLIVNTGDGRIRLLNYDGAADVRTGDGGIMLDGRFNQLAARTGDGSISLALPSDSNAVIETNAESVINDGVAVADSQDASKRVRRWTIGRGGSLFTLRTGDGRILLQRR